LVELSLEPLVRRVARSASAGLAVATAIAFAPFPELIFVHARLSQFLTNLLT